MQIVPTQPVANQSIQVQLDGQACTIYLQQLAYGLFIDLYVNNTLIIAGVICENLNRIVRNAYLGFLGDLAFCDTQGRDDPVYTSLGSRWVLLYLTEAEANNE